jgi:hypothetical protein
MARLPDPNFNRTYNSFRSPQDRDKSPDRRRRQRGEGKETVGGASAAWAAERDHISQAATAHHHEHQLVLRFPPLFVVLVTTPTLPIIIVTTPR